MRDGLREQRKKQCSDDNFNILTGHDPPLFSQTTDRLQKKVRKLVGEPIKPLRLTAIANLIRAGVTDRVTLNRALGVSMPTIAYVEKSFHWDLQSTVPDEVVRARNEVIRGER